MINFDDAGLLTVLSGAGFDTFLTLAVTLTGVDTLRAATLRVRVLRGVATVMRVIHLNSLIVHDLTPILRESLHIETIDKKIRPESSSLTVPMSVVIRYNWMIWGQNRVL